LGVVFLMQYVFLPFILQHVYIHIMLQRHRRRRAWGYLNRRDEDRLARVPRHSQKQQSMSGWICSCTPLWVLATTFTWTMLSSSMASSTIGPNAPADQAERARRQAHVHCTPNCSMHLGRCACASQICSGTSATP
jgi:hypothetical protein